MAHFFTWRNKTASREPADGEAEAEAEGESGGLRAKLVFSNCARCDAFEGLSGGRDE